MNLARIPWLGRLLFKDALFRIEETGAKTVYLTFDDGPIPQATPLVLDILKEYNAKATFFCVGENVKKHPEIYKRIIDEGHSVGNHTFNHLNGWNTNTKVYMDNIGECSKVVDSKLFRPPYGKLNFRQYKRIRKKFRVVFWDVLSQDYDLDLTPENCFNIVKAHTRPGSVIVFHDSLKALSKIPKLLPATLDFLKNKGLSTDLLQ